MTGMCVSLCKNVLFRVCEEADVSSHAWQTPALVCVLCLCLCVQVHAYMVIYVQTHVFQRLHMFAPFTQRFIYNFCHSARARRTTSCKFSSLAAFFFYCIPTRRDCKRRWFTHMCVNTVNALYPYCTGLKAKLVPGSFKRVRGACLFCRNLLAGLLARTPGGEKCGVIPKKRVQVQNLRDRC